MIIRLLGTGAAEGIPAFYSGSRVSEYARKTGGREMRTRSGALVDGHLKIDLPPDTLAQMHRDGLDARNWSAVLFTHSHDDHFALSELQYGLYPFNEMEHLAFPIYGNAEVCRRIQAMYPGWPIDLIETKSFEPFNHGEYTITPIAANHKADEDGQNHIIAAEGKTLLYATDTGVWHERTWEFLKDFKLDLLVIECTEGFRGTGYFGHLDLIGCLHVRDRLRGQGTLSESSKVVTTHHSHNGDATYAELEEALSREGIIAGFDGLEISL
jgi:phosphoribosyl 1,2-cyclic phosphate phosphodiesterase